MFRKSAIVTAIALLTGCASMFNGTTQPFSVSTNGDKNKSSTICHLANSFGSWNTQPNTLTQIYRDSEPLKITCENENQKGDASLQSNFSNGLFALDLIGTGFIGIMVDGKNKSLYEYETPASVSMTDSVLKEK